MRLSNSAIMASAVAALTFVLGFAWGNVLGVGQTFILKEWQTLAGALVAIVGIFLAFIGVRNTQRISVMIKEQDRLNALLPGLRQANDLLRLLTHNLEALRPQSLYLSHGLLKSTLQVADGESYEDIVRRKLPLADEHLHREMSQMVFLLMAQAAVMEVTKAEVDRTAADVAGIQTFAGSEHEKVRNIAEKVAEAMRRESEKMVSTIDSLEALAKSISDRISESEERRTVINDEIGSFFKG